MQKRFLIVKLSAIGDVIQAFPVAEYLKEKFPDCVIDWVVKDHIKPLLKAHPLLDNAFQSGGRYDTVFDLQGNCRSALVTFRAKAKHKVGFAYRSVAEWPNILVTSRRYNVDLGDQISLQYLSLVRQFFKDREVFMPKYIPLAISDEERQWVDELNVKGAILVCPSTTWPNKQPQMAFWRQFFGEGAKRVYVWGDMPIDREFDKEAMHFSRLPFTKLFSLMTQMSRVLSVDSFALHLSALAGVPTVAAFGPSSSKVYNPIGERHIAMQGVCPYGESFTKRCRLLRTCETGACSKNLT